MSSVPQNHREVLRHILQTRPEALDSCQLMKALLQDYLVSSDKSVYYLLSLVQECDIPQQLKSLKHLSVQSIGRLVRQLVEERSIEFNRALDGVLTWAYGLEIDLTEVEQLAFIEQPSPVCKSNKIEHAKGTKPTKHQSKNLRKPQPKNKMQEAIASYISRSLKYPEAVEPTNDLKLNRQNREVFTLNLPQGLSLNLEWCPNGTFLMGSPSAEVGRLEDEELHKVTLSSGFWIGQYPVTQEQYKAVLPGRLREVSHPRWPVVGVTWEEAREFCCQIDLKSNPLLASSYQVTLPTEAQWEYACRAGQQTAYNDGQEGNRPEGLKEVGWFEANSGHQLGEVGRLKPNDWKLYDMHGSVWEWCLDWYRGYVSHTIDPKGPVDGTCRVVRGGSFLSSDFRCRSASRNYYTSSYRSLALGFRVVVCQNFCNIG